MSCSTLDISDKEDLKPPDNKELKTSDSKDLKTPNNKELKIKMQTQCIIPDLLPNYPPATLNVMFDGVKVELGNLLTPTQVKDKPVVTWDADPDLYYLICMTDLDAPSRENPTLREWHHWLLGDIPGDEVSRGVILAEYIGAAPPKGSGFHRYVILLYVQPKRIRFYDEKRLTNTSWENRELFSITKFAEKYNLGEPIAANFFQAEWDDYVPKIYKQLSCCFETKS